MTDEEKKPYLMMYLAILQAAGATVVINVDEDDADTMEALGIEMPKGEQ